MAIAAGAVWEVRSTGNDNNGGGYVSGGGGTDRSQQAAAQVAFNGTTVTASTAGIGAVITLSGYTATAADVGNILQITGGTNFTTGFYQITAQAGTTWTLDRNCTTAAGSAMVGNMGGALATPTKAINSAMVGSNTVYIQSATYLIATTLTPPAGGVGAQTSIVGYTASRTDLGKPNITVNNAAIAAFTLSNAYLYVGNFILRGDGGVTKGTYGINCSVGPCTIENVQATVFTTIGINLAGDETMAVGCQVNAMVAGATAAFQVTGGVAQALIDCYADANPCHGFLIGASRFRTIRCIADSNSGTSDGFSVGGGFAGTFLDSCIAYNNGRDGIRFTSYCHNPYVKNCIFVSNGGFGLNNASGSANQGLGTTIDYNAYYNNTSGQVSNIVQGAHVVTLTGVPFTNAGSQDFTLNNTASQGAACRGAGGPPSFLGVTGTNYKDIGPFQHQDPAATGSAGYTYAQ